VEKSFHYSLPLIIFTITIDSHNGYHDDRISSIELIVRGALNGQ
jgi:hypothetical protein